MMNIRRLPNSSRRQSRGVVLAVSLILLAVIAITAAAAIKSVMSSDQIGANIRSSNLAYQAAEAALRWCESQVIVNSGLVIIQPEAEVDAAPVWRTVNNWTNNNVSVAVPLTVLTNTASNTNRYTTQPRCIAEDVSLPPPGSSTIPEARIVRITARGFSPDYSRDNNGVGTGGEVWLQSTLSIPTL